MSKKILVIDDDKDFTMLISLVLSRKDHEVYVAHTIEDGLNIIEENKLDVIFLDNQLPDGFGWSKTDYILSIHPDVELNLISGGDVPKTLSTKFNIFEKITMLEELNNY
jgi:DNA-binding NtrC family response regulator